MYQFALNMIYRHSGMDAGIQRPGMAIFGLLQAISSVKVSHPCDWIPASMPE